MGAEARRRQGRAGAGARGARLAGGRQALAGARTRRQAWLARQVGAGARGLGARPGRAGWPWDVHSVHSACFWPGSTRYFPESKFLDIVREPGS